MQDWIRQQHTTEVTAANLPDLLHIACAYSSNDTLKLLLRWGSRFMPDDYLFHRFLDTDDEPVFCGSPPVVFPKKASESQLFLEPPTASQLLQAEAECAQHHAWAHTFAGLLKACILPPAHASNMVVPADKLRTLTERPACRLVGEREPEGDRLVWHSLKRRRHVSQALPWGLEQSHLLYSCKHNTSGSVHGKLLMLPL